MQSAIEVQRERLKAARARMGMASVIRPVFRRPVKWEPPPYANDAPIEVFSDTFRTISINTIIAETAREYGTTSQDIISNRRWRELIEPRHVAMYIAVTSTRHSLPAVGRIFRRDHTTVLHAKRKVEALLPGDANLSRHVSRIIERACWKPSIAVYWGA